MQKLGSKITILNLFLLASVSSFAGAGARQILLKGFVSTDSSSKGYTRCVGNVLESFKEISRAGRTSSFSVDNTVKKLSNSKHWQGVQTLEKDDKNYLIVSRSARKKAAFVIVDMMSSKMVGQVTNADFSHGGGIQIYGDVLAWPIEDYRKRDNKKLRSEVLFYDLSNPLKPALLPYKIQRAGRNRKKLTAGAVGLTKLDSGRYLSIVANWGARDLDFYLSSKSDLTSDDMSFELMGRWNYSELSNKENLGAFEKYQSIQLVNQCDDGKIYLLGSYGKKINKTDEHWLELFTLDNDSKGKIRITKLAKKSFVCEYPGDSRESCDFQSSSGGYVSSEGKLEYFSTESSAVRINREERSVNLTKFE